MSSPTPESGTHAGTTTPARVLMLGALGIVFGDIGTSPLYAFKEVFTNHAHPVAMSPGAVMGVLSMVFWSLAIVVTAKYVGIILRLDNRGEGGVMALTALALRGLPANGKTSARVIALGMIGAALFYGDAVITPAISVLSAVEGLGVATPTLQPFVLPITVAVLIGLFAFQRSGTSAVGALFGPVMLVWFSVLALLGVTNIVQAPGVIAALSPHHALTFIFNEPLIAFFALGSVVLAVTGAEALYADMGHFGRTPIQRAWLWIVFPALMLNYLGQGALVLTNPGAIANPFYQLAPSWALYPLVGLATLATVIASQAVISGVFSITQQAIQLGYAPRVDIRHTSDTERGQIYLPRINLVLLLAVLTLVLGFGSSDKLASAYGLSVVGAMAIDGLLAIRACRERWADKRWLRWVLGAFLVVDAAYLAANSIKVVDGGWFPLAFGALVFLLLSTWRAGRMLLGSRLARDAMPLDLFIQATAGTTRVQGNAVFLTTTPEATPNALLHSLKHFKVLHERVVLLTVSTLDQPRVTDSRRVLVEKLDNGFWRVKVFFGFMERPDLPTTLDWCEEQGLALDAMETTFFVGRETLIPSIGSTEMSYWRERLFVRMYRNASSAAGFFKLPPNRVVELGSQVVL